VWHYEKAATLNVAKATVVDTIAVSAQIGVGRAQRSPFIDNTYYIQDFFQKRILTIEHTWLHGSFRQLYSVMASVGVVTTNRRL